MRIVYCALGGFVLDLLLGDPAVLTPIHPVVLIGRGITFLERILRRVFSKTKRGELAAGILLAILIPLLTLACGVLILWVLESIWRPLAWAAQIVWCWQALAVKNLKDESMNVYRFLAADDLPGARKAVARIVGRDTETLSAEGVTRAAVETVAENFSDGVAAPLFYMLLGGPLAALVYKSINTMDSMVGYKNGKYLYFGRAAAKLDDAANFLPARIAALLLIVSARLTGFDAGNARRIWRRDRRCHASPNSAQCEAVAAGALRIRLGGPSRYFGELVQKPYIGDDIRPAEPEDIRRACRLLYAGSVLGLIASVMMRCVIILLLG